MEAGFAPHSRASRMLVPPPHVAAVRSNWYLLAGCDLSLITSHLRLKATSRHTTLKPFFLARLDSSSISKPLSHAHIFVLPPAAIPSLPFHQSSRYHLHSFHYCLPRHPALTITVGEHRTHPSTLTPASNFRVTAFSASLVSILHTFKLCLLKVAGRKA